jgi:hypothetical protein
MDRGLFYRPDRSANAAVQKRRRRRRRKFFMSTRQLIVKIWLSDLKFFCEKVSEECRKRSENALPGRWSSGGRFPSKSGKEKGQGQLTQVAYEKMTVY